MGQIKTLLTETEEFVDGYAQVLLEQKIILMEGLTELGDHLVLKGDKDGQKIMSTILIKYYQIM